CEQAWRWLQISKVNEVDFAFESVESEDSPLIWFRRTELGWIVGAVQDTRRESDLLPLKSLQASVESFSQRTIERAHRQLGVDVGRQYLRPDRQYESGQSAHSIAGDRAQRTGGCVGGRQLQRRSSTGRVH